jgi:phosphonate transport system substrate-binding protein
MKSKVLLFRWSCLPAIICLSILCNSCKGKSKNYEPTYATDSIAKKVILFGVPTQTYYETTDLFVDYLNKHLIGAQVKLVTASDFSDWIDRLGKQHFDITTVSGIQALEGVRNGCSILGVSVDEVSYAGAILVHKDSSINTFADLKGKTIASPGYPALAGHVMPVVYLSKHGINVNSDARFNYVQSFESVILNVYLGKCAAGFSSTNNWRLFLKERPEIASKVALKWTTPAIAGVGLLLRHDVDKGLADQIRNIVFNMHLNGLGKKALAKLGYVKIEPADSTTFQPVKQVLKEYNDLVENRKQ